MVNREWEEEAGCQIPAGFGESGESRAINDYRDLQGWIDAVALTAEIYVMTRHFPREELFGLTSQMRRAATSVAANISEGYGRDTTGQFIQFLRRQNVALTHPLPFATDRRMTVRHSRFTIRHSLR